MKFVVVNEIAVARALKFYEYATVRKGHYNVDKHCVVLTLKSRAESDEYKFKDMLEIIVDEFSLNCFNMYYTYELDKTGMTHIHGLLISKKPIPFRKLKDLSKLDIFSFFNFDIGKVKSAAWVKYMLKDQASWQSLSTLEYRSGKVITDDPIFSGRQMTLHDILVLDTNEQTCFDSILAKLDALNFE